MPESLNSKIMVGAFAAIISLAVIGLLSYRSTLSLMRTVDEQTSAHEIIVDIRSVQAHLNSARGSARGYYLTGDTSILPQYRGALSDARAKLRELHESPLYLPFAAAIDSLDEMVTDRIDLSQERMDAYHRGGIPAVASTMHGDEDDKRIEERSAAIEGRIRERLISRQTRTDRLARSTLGVITLGTALGLIFLSLSAMIIRHEVVQRQRAYSVVREREERLNDLVENASELIQTTTPDGRLTGANTSWLNTLGYQADQLGSLDIIDIVQRDQRDTWCDAVQRTIDGERVKGLAIDLVAADGSPVHLIGNLSCRFADGRATAIRGIFRDVTETREAEAELREQEHRNRQFLEGMPIGVFVLNADGTPAYANRAALEILGRGIVPGSQSSELSDIYRVYRAGSSEAYPSDRLPVVRALAGERVIVEDLEIDRDGVRTPLQVTAAPLYSSDGDINGAVAAFTDITERRQMERLKDELISVVSHELRTPLTSIRGALGLVGSGRLGLLNDQGKRMIDIAVTDTDRLVRLINDMLDIERMQSGRLEIHKGLCNATELIEQAAATMQPLAARTNIRIEVDSAPVSVLCDSDRITQTLTNLIGNAIKFSPPDGVVRVAAAESGQYVEFSVSDEGRGIPREKIETIFERFQQVDASDAREKGGAGLGLAISRSIVAQHGGRIWAESDGVRGSKFLFTLPRMTQTDLQARPAIEGTPLLLVAEDDSAAAEVLKTTLETNGYRVALAGTGTEMLALAGSTKPAAILLDIIMPEMNGWEAMAQLKSNPATRDIPVIVVSALASEMPHNDERVAAWIAKPYNEDVLSAALQVAFQLSEHPTVLIVEDDENLGAVLVAQFENSGLGTQYARDGAEAIRVAQEHPPDLLVLDLMLPEKDGFAVVEWLRQHEQLRHLPLIVYTALELDTSEKERLTLGPSVFMTKSRAEPQEVAQRVTELLNSMQGPNEVPERQE